MAGVGSAAPRRPDPPPLARVGTAALWNTLNPKPLNPKPSEPQRHPRSARCTARASAANAECVPPSLVRLPGGKSRGPKEARQFLRGLGV